jgi:hypothetical protein
MFTKKNNNREKFLKEFGKLKEDSFVFEQIEKYFRNKDNSSAFQILSDKTCNDLDFQELFMFFDRTTSKVGQQFLYNKLRCIPKDLTKNIEDEKLIKHLSDETDFRTVIQSKLIKLDSNYAYYITTLFQDEHLKPPKWFFIIRLLSFTSLLSLILLPWNPQLVFVLLVVFIINMVIHYWNKKNLYQYLGSIPQLIKLSNTARELFQYDIFKQINPELDESIKIIDKVRNRMSFFKLEAKFESDSVAIMWGILELFKTLFLLEPLLLFGVLKQLDTKRKEIEDVFIFVGQIDSIISISSLRKGLDLYCIPEITDKQKTIIAKEIYHPLIHDCIKNSINVNKKSVLLTGSNMSGKTSFIRTIGINTITSFTGLKTLVQAMHFSARL